MSDTLFLTARDTARRYGLKDRSASGKPTNVGVFLKRLRARHPDFPQPVNIAGRDTYPLNEIEAFERKLVAERPQRRYKPPPRRGNRFVSSGEAA